MKLVERHIIKENNKYYKELLEECIKSNNLYNRVLFIIRQHYFHLIGKQYDNDIASDYQNKCLSYYDLDKILKENKDQNYYSLPTNCGQEVIKQVLKNFNIFYYLLDKKRKGDYNKPISIPKYRKENLNILIYNTAPLHKKKLEQGIIKIPNTDIELKVIHNKECKQIRIIPKLGYIIYEVIYDKKEKELKKDNNRYMSIDLGINNLATCTSNVIKSFIINGKPIKSINQYYNKQKAKLYSKENKITKRIKRLSLKRNNKIETYLHQASRYIVNQLVSNNINTLIIGKNIEWKQDTSLGKINNQQFIFIPFNKFTLMLEYKCKLEGINVIYQEESYTSKASFLDNDYIPIYEVDDKKQNFSGQRIKRGLYQSKNNQIINADINGSLNILKKYLNVVSNNIIRDRGLIVRPFVLSFR